MLALCFPKCLRYKLSRGGGGSGSGGGIGGGFRNFCGSSAVGLYNPRVAN